MLAGRTSGGRRQRLVSRLLLVLGCSIAVLFGPSAFVPRPQQPLRASAPLAADAAALSLAAPAAYADTVYLNPEALKAAGVDPAEYRKAIIETQPADVQFQLALQDFVTEFAIPFWLGLGLVYGFALTFGLVEGPFDQSGEDSKSKPASKKEADLDN
mmetsp:Transcript_39651/g.93415  ORF Transcript_39651/g.93415 Transcript_39651/m.93415 type:complete len:157 (-) Transcript_39651:165-635(-)